MKKTKTNLDEMQELSLRRIESRGFWLLWSGLLLAIAAQGLIYGPEAMEHLKGEVIVFMAACVYEVAASIRGGIWDRRMKPNFKTNLLLSCLGGALTGLFIGLANLRSFGNPSVALLSGVIAGAFTLALCMLALSVLSGVYKKRHAQLEDESDKAND